MGYPLDSVDAVLLKMPEQFTHDKLKRHLFDATTFGGILFLNPTFCLTHTSLETRELRDHEPKTIHERLRPGIFCFFFPLFVMRLQF